jgi:hypothetical protein
MKKTTNRWYTFITGILLFALTGFLAWGVVKIWLLFWDYISHSKPEIGAAIIAGSFTLLVSVLSVVVAKVLERNKELALRRWEQEQELRKQYVPIYQELVEFLFKLLRASKTEKPMSEEEMNEFFVSFTKKTIVWGSDRFLKDFSTFRDSSAGYAQLAQSGNTSNADLIETMVTLENLLYSIRADCGHENKGLKKGDLLTLFITDLRNYIPK